MSLFLAQEDETCSDEERVNKFINNSFLAISYRKISTFIVKKIGKYTKNSNIIKKLDSIYFLVLAVLIFSIPFVQTSALGLFASCLILISFISSLLNHKKFQFSTIHIPVMIYLAILAVSVGFSSLFLPSLKGFAKMLIYIGAYFSFFEFLKKNPQRILPVIGLIAISCAIELLFSIKQMIFGVDELASWQDKTGVNPENMMNRVFGTLKPFNPNLFAAYLLAATPCIFIRSIISLLKKYKKAGITFAAFGLLGLVTIVQTGCRGAYIGLFLSFIFLLILLYITLNTLDKHISIPKKQIWMILGGLVLVGIIAIALSPSLSHRLTSIFTFRGDSSNSYRMNVYASSLKMLMDNFWIGIGTGNTTYRLIYGLYMVTGYDALGAYNIYLEMGVESGIFAIITFLWTIILAFGKGISKIKELDNKLDIENKIILVGCMVGIFAMLMHGIVDTVWYRPQLQLIFWLYLAIISVMTMRNFADEE
ncbi:MAG: O-antigen ligase family protein [bacterium]|nr:O-antigen ligase family protein [bacterium]